MASYKLPPSTNSITMNTLPSALAWITSMTRMRFAWPPRSWHFFNEQFRAAGGTRSSSGISSRCVLLLRFCCLLSLGKHCRRRPFLIIYLLCSRRPRTQPFFFWFWSSWWFVVGRGSCGAGSQLVLSLSVDLLARAAFRLAPAPRAVRSEVTGRTEFARTFFLCFLCAVSEGERSSWTSCLIER